MILLAINNRVAQPRSAVSSKKSQPLSEAPAELISKYAARHSSSPRQTGTRPSLGGQTLDGALHLAAESLLKGLLHRCGEGKSRCLTLEQLAWCGEVQRQL